LIAKRKAQSVQRKKRSFMRNTMCVFRHARFVLCPMLYTLCCILVISGCATTSSSRVNMGDPSTYVKVNFLKENYDEVIRYSRTLGVLNSANNRLSILYYVGLSQLAKKDYRRARETFNLLKSRDSNKKYQDVVDIRIADSYFLDQKYHLLT